MTFLNVGTSSSAGNSVNLVPNTTYRIAGTISTAHTGLVTMKLFLAKGNVPIDTNSSTHLLATRTSATALDRGNKLSDGFGSYAGYQFGIIDNLDPDTKTLDLDSFRLYKAVPAAFSITPERGR